MKKLFLAAAAVFALFAAPTFAGPTENITGCATAQADNSNFTVFVDPTCYKAPETSGGGNIFDVVGGLAIGSLTED
jgi:hypothetical protein